MSRIPKWKVEKAKVKVVFRLQFHATHIPPGWDKLFLSFIPSDTGKATAKTTKANVRNGNCKWSDPIYETTRLIQDTRTKKYDEKLYNLVVAMGSSRSSLLGEVNINLADFADALKPSSFELPLHSCDLGTLLHVTVQLLTSKTGFREFEQQRDATVKGFQMISGQISRDPGAIVAASADTANEQIEKVNTRVGFKESSAELPSLEEVGESNEDYEHSATGIDGLSYISESSYAEKNDDSFKSTTPGDVTGFPLGQNPSIKKENQNVKRLSAQGNNDRIHGWSSEYSVNKDSTPAYEENNRLSVRLEAAESVFLQLKLEARSLQSITDELGAETQSLTEQLATELASGEKLAREVFLLKSECSKLKNDLEDIKSAKTMQHSSERSHFSVITGLLEDSALASGQNSLSHDLQLKCLQGILLIEGKIREIQNKACLECHGSGFDLSSDFEVLQCVIQNLKQGITQASSLEMMDGIRSEDIQATRILQAAHFVQGQGLESSYRDHHIPEDMLHFLSNYNQIFQETEPLKKNIVATSVEDKMCELLERLQESNIEKENLTKKMDQMECYYEALIQELEVSHKQTFNDLENLRAEHASCLYTTSTLQSQIEKLHQDMNEQLIKFAEERHSLDSLKKESEERAMASETALKRVRWNYSIAADRLQKDLELLSFQVMSMYETNENLAKQAFTDASRLLQHHPEEHSGEVQLCMQKDFILSDKEKYMPSLARTQPEIVKINYELPPLQNGVPEKASYKAIHYLDFTEQNKGISHTTVPMNIGLQMQDEGNAHVNSLKLEDIRKLTPEIQRNVELSYTSIPKCKHENHATETKQISDLCAGADNQPLDDKHVLEEMKLSVHMLRELQLNSESELSEMHVCNLHCEVFSRVLQETLRDVNHGVEHMKVEMDQLKQQLTHLTDVKESLILKLRSVLDEVGLLRENEAKLTSKCDVMTLENHILEAKIHDLLEENTYFTEKVAECETLMVECRAFESKYNACSEQREEFENLLKQENLQRSYLQSEISCMTEDFQALKEQFDEQSSINVGLQKTLSFLQGKLGDLLSITVSYNEQIDSSAHSCIQQELESKNYVAMLLLMEQFHKEAYKTIFQLREEKKEIEEERNMAQYSLNQTESHILFMKQMFESELKEITEKLDMSNIVSQKLQLELQDVAGKLKISSETEKKHRIENSELLTKFTDLEVKLQHATNENRDLVQKLLLLEGVNEALERTKLSYLNCIQENKTLMMSIQSGNEGSIQMEDELNSLKETLRYTHDKMKSERKFREELEAEVAELTSQMKKKDQQLLSFDEQKTELVHLRERISDLEKENTGLQHLLSQSEESQRKFREQCEAEIADLTSQLKKKGQQLLSFDEQKTELLHIAKRISDLETENIGLQRLLLQSEEGQREFRQDYEAVVADLNTQLKKKSQQLLSFDEQKAEFVHLKERILDVETENFHLQHLLSLSEETHRKLDGESLFLHLQVAEIENHLAACLEYSLARDVEVAYMKSQFQYRIPELIDQIKTLERDLKEFHISQLDIVASLKVCKASEAQLVEEKTILLSAVQLLTSECDTIACEKEGLVDNINKRNTTWIEFEDLKARAATMEADNSREKLKYTDEICQLNNMLVCFDKEVENLWSSRAEIETINIILSSKLDEQQSQMSYLEECDYELRKLREQHNELSYKLSEQILKTEEFKNLSIHLRELKDKADAECHQALEKREIAGPLPVMQESLRIAFIKEQHESKLQELRNQVYVSKKYAEEMLLKLQNALNEAESGKNSEISLAKRNEELSTKILELEAELQTAVTDRRELVKLCDRMKAELECTILSLDCCKEEKLKLEGSLQECNEERTKIRVELDLVKRLLENMASITDMHAQIDLEPGPPNTTSFGQLLVDGSAAGSCYGKETTSMDSINPVSTVVRDNHLDESRMLSPLEVEDTKLACVNGSSYSSLQPNLQSLQDGFVDSSALVQENLSKDNRKHIIDIKAHLKEQQRLKTGMDLLLKELERLKNENLSSHLPLEENYFDPALQGLQRELTQLDMANEHLGSIFPLFKELPVNGNALGRVLALELELAESLQAKKSDARFQSSFLKQHTDEEAVYQSFRDINDLIKDLLEFKRRHTIIEAELKEMQDRYSQLSLQFAEVEGERQKLVMTLKNRSLRRS